MAISADGPTDGDAARDRGLHRLRVARVVRETAEASSFVLEVPPRLRRTFAYDAGQFCTFRVWIDGRPHLRSYSMSSAPGVDGDLRVTVKRVPGGLVSNWMIDTLDAGSEVEATAPAGTFRLGRGDRDVVAFAAGSGITPVFSLVKTALATTSRRVRLLYANRDRDAVIFSSALQGYADWYARRFELVHHLDVDRGHVDAGAVRDFAGPPVDADLYVCGPGPFLDVVEGALQHLGVPRRRIHLERFTPAGPSDPGAGPGPVDTGAPAAPGATGAAGARVTVEIGGRRETGDHHPGDTVLQTARQVGLAPPFSCESGNCATCMARVVEGSVAMRANNALTDDEVAEGWALTCQAVPTTAAVHVVYEDQ